MQNASTIHLTRPVSCTAPRRVGVVGHERALRPDEIQLLDGIPVTSLARTWLDLAAMLSLNDPVAAADHLVSEHRRSFAWPRIARVPQVPGVRRI
ncbi:hypothetical protein [Specibacter cremeus]|uniref:hypothetical protein n=1 Tax=Specibacter cremeus TaxID=1629051 RepID=UPI000F7ADE3D|nr:hypothetical protein [Specibacter cremeus]